MFRRRFLESLFQTRLGWDQIGDKPIPAGRISGFYGTATIPPTTTVDNLGFEHDFVIYQDQSDLKIKILKADGSLVILG